MAGRVTTLGSGRAGWWPLAGVLVIAGLVRVPFAAAKDVWFDEAFTWRLVSLPCGEIVARTAGDVHPPGYYLLMKGWVSLAGDSIAGMRGVSVVLSLVTIAGVYAVATTLHDSCLAATGRGDVPPGRVGAVTAAAAAVSPYAIQTDTDARMYPLYTALLAFATWFFLRTLTAPTRPAPWAGFVACLTAALYTHNYALFFAASFAAAHGLVICLGGKVPARRAAAAYLVVGLAYLPWLAVLAAQVERVREDYWLPVLRVAMIGQTISAFAYHPDVAVTGFWPTVAGVGVGVGVVLTAGVRRGPAAAGVAVLTALPFALAAAAAAVVPLWADRYFRFSHLLLLVTLFSAIARVPWEGVRVGLVVGFFAFTALALADLAGRLPAADDQGIRAACLEVVRQAEPGDTALVDQPYLYLPCAYFLSEHLPTYLSKSAAPRHYSGAQILSPSDVPPDGVPRGRVWYIASTPYTYPDELHGATLVHVKNYYPVISGKTIYSVQLYRIR